MRIPKILWNLFAAKKSGSPLASSTAARISYGALSVSDLAPKNRNLFLWAVLASLICFSLLSCGTVHTSPDQAPAYKDDNYHSAEITICGTTYFGVAGCSFASGDSAKEPISVQGYGTGEIEIFSDLCHIEWKQRYALNQALTVSLATLLGQNVLGRADSCTLKVVVSPDPFKNSEDAVAPRVGEIVLEVRSPGISDLGLPPGDQVRASQQPDSAALTISMTEPGVYQFVGCSGAPIQTPFDKGLVSLPALSRSVSCKYQISVRLASGKKLEGVFLRNVYASETVLLAQPVLERTPKKLCVTGDPVTTTYVSIDEIWGNKQRICKTGAGPFKVRVFTVRRNLFEVIQ